MSIEFGDPLLFKQIIFCIRFADGDLNTTRRCDLMLLRIFIQILWSSSPPIPSLLLLLLLLVLLLLNLSFLHCYSGYLAVGLGLDREMKFSDFSQFLLFPSPIVLFLLLLAEPLPVCLPFHLLFATYLFMIFNCLSFLLFVSVSLLDFSFPPNLRLSFVFIICFLMRFHSKKMPLSSKVSLSLLCLLYFNYASFLTKKQKNKKLTAVHFSRRKGLKFEKEIQGQNMT